MVTDGSDTVGVPHWLGAHGLKRAVIWGAVHDTRGYHLRRIGTTLAHYEIKDLLGQGGMATVYLAADQKHNRKVELKVMLPEKAEAIGHDRFLREIETAARLSHPHILPLYDSGASDGQLYYVMPHVAGGTLRDKLNKEKQLSLEEAMRLTCEIASALSHAHGHGLVNRDIKPENVLLADDIALVADFGIAHVMALAPDGTSANATAETQAQLTSPGQLIGTPLYMAPEQAGGMMVSLIQSNYTGFGSGYVVPEVGFGLQNRGGLFALDETHPNKLEPGKRPFHTIIPAFLTKDGEPLMAFGLMGGGMQPQGHAQVVINLVDFGMNLQEAGDVTRFYHTGSSQTTGTVMRDGGELHIEAGLSPEILKELESRGHTLTPTSVGAYGGYQAIWRNPETGGCIGATEMRKDGCAAEF